MRRIGFFSLLVAAILFVQNSSATMLPVSSYADGYWQGSRFYEIEVVDDVFLRGRIDFDVYDTLGGNEFVEAGFAAPGDGQYIYAYQIFNDYPASEETVAFFSVFELAHNPMDVYQDSIGSQDDTPESGVASSSSYFTGSNLKAVWLFDGGVLTSGEHSWFLVFSSDSAPVPGDYEISAESGEFPAVPEPTVITLLGLGSAILFARRKRLH